MRFRSPGPQKNRRGRFLSGTNNSKKKASMWCSKGSEFLADIAKADGAWASGRSQLVFMRRMSVHFSVDPPSLRVFLPVGGCFYTPEKNLPFSFYIAQLAQLGPGCVLCGYKKRCVAILGLARWLMAADGARSMGVCPMAHKFSAPWRTGHPAGHGTCCGCCLPTTSAFVPSGSYSALPSWFEHLHR